MAVTRKIIGRVSMYVGDWDQYKVGGYGKQNRVTLYGSEFESKIEGNTYAPATYDDVEGTVTFDEEHWAVISNGSDAWLANDKIEALGVWEENEEFLRIYLDEDSNFLFGIREDGSIEWAKGVPTPIQDAIAKLQKYTDSRIDALDDMFNVVSSPEYIYAVVDRDKRFLFGVNVNGVFEVANMNIDFPNFPDNYIKWLEDVFSEIDDPEDRMEVVLDEGGKIIGYRDKDGMRHETSMSIDKKLELGKEAMSEFQSALRDSGFRGGSGDWSDYISEDGDNPLHLPMPKCAIVNLLTDFNLVNLSKEGRSGAVEGVNWNIPITMEFWDMQGNYFEKPVCISGQGNSTMTLPKKNIAVDMFDSSQYNKKGQLAEGDAFKVAFGDWIPCDSFHLKANASESFKFVNNLSYKFYDSIVKTRGVLKDYVWKKGAVDLSQIGTSAVNVDLAAASWDDGAKCFPDGFPCIVYQNGAFWGIFAWSIKKDRNNYHLNKKTAENIHLDGIIDDESIFMANGNIDWDIFTGKEPNWDGRTDGVEVRNPKDLYCMDGKKYNADTHNEELIDDTSDYWLKKSDGTPLDPNNEDDAKVIKNHKTTKKVKGYIEDLSRVMTTVDEAEQIYLASERTAADLATLKAVFETYFDVENLIDYMIHGDITDNWDGFRGKNWQWFTYDSVKWYCGLYDQDLTFGYYWVYGVPREPKDGHTCERADSAPAHTLLFNRYIITYYNAELEARYAELRTMKVIDADSIANIMSDNIDYIGKDVYEKEWAKWDSDMPNDNIYRLHNWLVAKIAMMDTLYHYNG